MKNKQSILVYLSLIIGVVVLINIIADRFFFRLDFTGDKRYTLSKATKNILDSIKEPVTVVAYFSEQLPPEIAQVRREFKEMLVEYATRSKGKVLYEFINPNKDEQTEKEAMQAGVQPVMINMREKDQVKQQKAYIGAVVKYSERKEIIPVIQPGTAMEYALSTSIKKLTVTNRPLIGILQGHGEATIAAMQQIDNALSILYNIEPVTLNDSTANLNNYLTVAIVAPKDSFPASHLKQLDDFLAQGKNLFIAINRVSANFQTATGSVLSTGLETWLANKGLSVESKFVIDQSCGSIMVNQQQGQFTFQSQVNFPYLPIISSFTDHPITKGLETVLFQFASPIVYTGGSSSQTFTILAKTTDKSGSEAAPLYFDINRQWQQTHFMQPRLNVAGLLSGKIVGEKNSRIVLVGDGDFPVNGEGEGKRQVSPDNANLMVNSIDFLSDDTGLIDLRTKAVVSRPITQLEDGTKTLLKYTNFLLPILLIIGFGIGRAQYRRNLRLKRMTPNYL